MKHISKSPMQIYTCPTCGEEMERDLLLFTEHTQQHIQDEMKKKSQKRK